MGKHERFAGILALLSSDGSLTVETAAAELAVSPATVRRDFDQLARQQLLTRTHGGAVSNNTSYDLPLRYKAARHAEEKVRIGQAAAELVPAGSTVGINGGTTSTEVARALALRAGEPDRHGGPAITIVTNALNIANEMTVRPYVKTVVTGGVARAQSYELTGPLADATLAQISLDVVILGVDAVDVAMGASAHHEGEAHVNRLLAQRARRVIVVADASKLGRATFAQICPLADVDVVVTDEAADPSIVAALTEAGVEVRTA